MAQEWLTRSPYNRREDESNTAKIAQDMKDGAFVPDTNTLLCDENGDLLDGHHRMQAVIKSGTTQTFWVRAARRSDMLVIDTGRTRDLSNTLQFIGVNDKDVALVQAGIKGAIEILRGRDVRRSRLLISNVVGGEIGGHLGDISEGLASARDLGRANRAAQSDILALFFVLRGSMREQFKQFCDALAIPGRSEQGRIAIDVYRNWFDRVLGMRRAGKKNRPGSTECLTALIQTWNSWLRNDESERFIQTRNAKGYPVTNVLPTGMTPPAGWMLDKVIEAPQSVAAREARQQRALEKERRDRERAERAKEKVKQAKIMAQEKAARLREVKSRTAKQMFELGPESAELVAL